MNQNENDLHVKLCADLLGELPAAERATLERALANDPELRAERARIAATIGLVESTLGATPDETMPAATRERLMAEATRRAGAGRRWIVPISLVATAAAAVFVVSVLLRDDAKTGGETRKQEIAAAPPATDGDADLGEASEKQDDASRPGESKAARNETLDFEKRSAGLDAKPAGTEREKSAQMVEEERRLEDSIEKLKATAPQDAATDQRDSEHLKVLQPNGSAAPPLAGTNKKNEPVASDDKRIDPVLHDLHEEAKSPPGDSVPPIPAPQTDSVDLVSQTVPAPPPGPATQSKDPGLVLEDLARQWRSHDSEQGVVGGVSPPANPAGAGGEAQLRKAADYRATQSKETESKDAASDAADGFASNAGVAPQEAGFLNAFGLVDADDGERRRQLSADDVFQSCVRRPNETPSMMFFRFWGDHAFERTATNAQSTFGVDVDTASWALARNYIERGMLPPKEAVRTEEFLNWFKADVPAPTDRAFAIHLDGGKSRYGAESDLKDARLLRVVVRGRDVAKAARPPLQLTCVIDVSGSMQQENRLELVKNSLRLLVAGLDAKDSVALVTFNTTGRLVLPMTSVAERATIEAAIAPLFPEGSTNAEAGLEIAYGEAGRRFDAESANRVVMFSDGVANVGSTNERDLTAKVANERARGILLNTYGVGMGNHNDVLLEQLADLGDGVCSYIDTPDEAKRQLVDRFTGAMVTIARDVKVQVEFDPAQVDRWRLLGYENRAIANQDFRNDAVDAGEVGAGHQVTALYELEPSAEFGRAGAERPAVTVRLRWKPPVKSASDAADETATTIQASALATDWSEQGVGLKRAALVAQFAELLRRSQHARGDSIDDLAAQCRALASATGDADTGELANLVEKCKSLVPTLPANDPLIDALDAIRKNRILRAELEDLAKSNDQALVDELERQNRELEARIRELLKNRLGK